MACMEIGPEMEDKGHEHSFDQCGIVTHGEIEMFIENDRRILKAMDTYFKFCNTKPVFFLVF